MKTAAGFTIVLILAIVVGVTSRKRSPKVATPAAVAAARAALEPLPSTAPTRAPKVALPRFAPVLTNIATQTFRSNGTAHPGELDPRPDGAGPFPHTWDELTPRQKEKFGRDSVVARILRTNAKLETCLGDRAGDARGAILASAVFRIQPDGQTMIADRVDISQSTLASEETDRLVVECLDTIATASGPRPIPAELREMPGFAAKPGEEIRAPSSYFVPVRSDPWYTWLAGQ